MGSNIGGRGDIGSAVAAGVFLNLLR